MNRLKTLGAAIAALSIAAAPAKTIVPTKATPAPNAFNCLIASNVFVQHQTDPQTKANAERTFYFYLGRLSPAVTAPQLKAALQQTSNALKGVNAGALMNACFHNLQAEARMLQTAGTQPDQQK